MPMVLVAVEQFYPPDGASLTIPWRFKCYLLRQKYSRRCDGTKGGVLLGQSSKLSTGVFPALNV